jgi:RNA polymerase sigma-70 factor (ECF subfamily)
MPEWDDRDIVRYSKEAGKRDLAFKVLVEKYKERLYWHIRKLVISHDDADDVLQNTYVKAWKGLLDFREDSRLYTWLYRIATNEALTFLKHRKSNRLVGWEDARHTISETIESDAYFNGSEIQKKLQQAIQTLPEKQRLVFNMKYFEELKYEEMADILETSVGALKASYHHAVKKIEAYFETD